MHPRCKDSISDIENYWCHNDLVIAHEMFQALDEAQASISMKERV